MFRRIEVSIFSTRLDGGGGGEGKKDARKMLDAHALNELCKATGPFESGMSDQMFFSLPPSLPSGFPLR